jgi:hypothetical protein
MDACARVDARDVVANARRDVGTRSRVVEARASARAMECGDANRRSLSF